MQCRNSQLQRFEIDQLRLIRRAVRVKFDRYAIGILHNGEEQGSRAVHGQQAALVFEIDRVWLERDKVARLLRIVLIGVPRRNRVRKRERNLQT